MWVTGRSWCPRTARCGGDTMEMVKILDLRAAFAHRRSPCDALVGVGLPRLDDGLHCRGVVVEAERGLGLVKGVVGGHHAVAVDRPTGRQRDRGGIGVGVAE